MLECVHTVTRWSPTTYLVVLTVTVLRHYLLTTHMGLQAANMTSSLLFISLSGCSF